MKIYLLERDQWIARPLPDVFDFFSRAENLQRITPPWMHFKMHTQTPIDMQPGVRIEYTIRLAGIPMRWRTLITVWEPPGRFEDVQERGPYKLWKHEHFFAEHADGVLVRDRVRYALPFGPIGRVAHFVAVRSMLGAIFDYRFRLIGELLQ